jgi:hypothetical protein
LVSDQPQARKRTRSRRRRVAPGHARPVLLLGRRQVLNLLLTFHWDEHGILRVQVHLGQVDDADTSLNYYVDQSDQC